MKNTRLFQALERDLATLPAAVKWLEDGPIDTRQAVLLAKRRVLLMQLPLACALIGVSMGLKALGLIPHRGEAQLVLQALATLVFLWPPTLLHLAATARRDALVDVAKSLKLRTLAWVMRAFAWLTVLACVGVAGMLALGASGSAT